MICFCIIESWKKIWILNPFLNNSGFDNIQKSWNMTFSVCISMTISVMPANFLYILFQSWSKKTILVLTVWCCHDSHGSTTTPGLYLSVSHGTMHSFRPIIYLSSIIHHWVVLSSALSLSGHPTTSFHLSSPTQAAPAAAHIPAHQENPILELNTPLT